MVDHSKSFDRREKPSKFASLSVFVIVSAVVAFLLINYVFCPRYVLWKGLHLPAAWSNPEVNRAVDALRQIRNPFEPIDNPTNDIIQWRLLFPLIAHYTRLPDAMYFAIPHIGCIATLMWLTILGHARTQSRQLAFLASVAFGTASWFFVSAGWLAYFDSWYVFGLLIAAFHPLRRWLIASCLLVPWIDERFVLALPLTVVVRAIYFEQPISVKSKPLVLDVCAILAIVIPWVAYRVYLIYTAIDHSPSATAWQTPINHPVVVLDGLWNGLRCLWFFPIVLVLLLLSRRMIGLAIVVATTTFITVVLNLRFAGDISRSISNLIPLVVLGFIETTRCPELQWRKWLYWVTALNLFLPASHVIVTIKIPIFYFPYEYYRASHPPPEVSPSYYGNKGVEAWLRKDGSVAIEMFSTAIQLDSRFAEGYLNRGIVYRDLGHLNDAETDIARAIAISPKLYEAQFELALLLDRKGEKAKAVATLRKILDDAPTDDKLRPAIEELLRKLVPP